jgi:hypothetical protein
MNLIHIIVFVVILGLVYYLFNLIPLPGWAKTVISCLCILAVIVWLLQISGLSGTHISIK